SISIMKSIKKILIISSLTLASGAVSAQTSYSGYFLDEYTYRYEMNPAFGNSKGFVSFPALGNVNVAMRGSLHITDIIYKNPHGGNNILFTNSLISQSEAMNHLRNRKFIGEDVKLNIMSVGFNAFGGYNTVSLSANESGNISVPKEFFSLAKEGITNKTYNIDDLNGTVNGYATIALNHSRDIKQVPGLRVGAALKFYLGIANVDARLKEAELALGTDAWTAKTNAEVYLSAKGARFETDEYVPKGPEGGAPRRYVSGINMEDFTPGITGFGMGVDLGAEYKWRDFRFSAALLDLGFMSWSNTIMASTNGVQSFTTDAYTFSTNGDAPNSFDKEVDKLGDDISKLYQMTDIQDAQSNTTGMAATLNFGVDYEFPYYRNLHFGLVNSTRINGPYTWTQFRVSANVAPVKVFSANVNMEMGTFGVGFGWMLNLHVTGFNLFAGMDHTVGKLSKQFIPLNSNASFNFGINFLF
ncbi:MAG: hypothetical protein K2K97_05100, partial [Muribaculaceae bacterium]|nr:hypothetical protein [Muribaculaceae bacterium]